MKIESSGAASGWGSVSPAPAVRPSPPAAGTSVGMGLAEPTPSKPVHSGDAAPVEQAGEGESGEAARAAVEQINEFLGHQQRPMEAHYDVDEATHLVVIKLNYASSVEVLRQIPSEAAVRHAAALRSLDPHLMDEIA